MPGRRPPKDPEALSRVLLVCAGLLALAGVGFAVTGGWGIVVGLVLVGFAVGCVVIGRDDTTGEWCPECVARNPADAEVCESCGATLG